MELNYDKKDIAKSPKAKAEKNVLPEGWQLYVKRGVWNVRDVEGRLTQYQTEKEAWDFING